MITTAPRSLWWRLVISLVAMSLIAIGAATFMLYERFKVTNSSFRDRTLQNHARIIAQYIRHLPAGAPVKLSEALLEPFVSGHGKYAIVDENGGLLDASSGLTRPMAPTSRIVPKDYFITEGGEDSEPLYGISRQSAVAAGPVWVQVAFHDSSIIFDSVLEEFMEDIGWIWVPFVVSMLAVNIVVIRFGLKPLRRAAQLAGSIGPHSEAVRLPEEGLTSEVLALVHAVNSGFERMRTAYQSQRRFIADAAHELRTPVSVVKAHVAVLPDVPGIAALKEEVDSLERLVNQLLDSERLGTLSVEPNQACELGRLALDIATQLGPVAVASGRSIEVVPAAAPVLVNGSYDFLLGALRNLVENALRHTPQGTTVSITVAPPGTIAVADHGPGVPAALRQQIFQRFWQGRRDRAGGAGLGLDIVRRTIAAHRGEVAVADAPGGGAVFTMKLPALT